MPQITRRTSVELLIEGTLLQNLLLPTRHFSWGLDCLASTHMLFLRVRVPSEVYICCSWCLQASDSICTLFLTPRATASIQILLMWPTRSGFKNKRMMFPRFCFHLFPDNEDYKLLLHDAYRSKNQKMVMWSTSIVLCLDAASGVYKSQLISISCS